MYANVHVCVKCVCKSICNVPKSHLSKRVCACVRLPVPEAVEESENEEEKVTNSLREADISDTSILEWPLFNQHKDKKAHVL